MKTNPLLIQFEDTLKAEDYLKDKGFDIINKKIISFGEGYEHIFCWEFMNKYNKDIARIADLRCCKRKKGNLSNALFKHVQVAIKNISLL